jgi:hypothetical protein
VFSTLGAVNDESELGGVAGDLTTEEAAALLETALHPLLRRLLEARLEERDAE